MLSTNWVKLLGTKIVSRLNFEPHVSDLCKSASRQVDALLKLKLYLTFEARKILIESFVYSNFNYCSLVRNFISAKTIILRVCKKERYNSYLIIMKVLMTLFL